MKKKKYLRGHNKGCDDITVEVIEGTDIIIKGDSDIIVEELVKLQNVRSVIDRGSNTVCFLWR